MRKTDDAPDVLREPDTIVSSPILSTQWKCSECGQTQSYIEPSQPSQCECGGLWFETEHAVRIH
jgi:hypothetical protein